MNNVLVFCPHFYPGYKAGGVLTSNVKMLKSFGRIYKFYVICSDRDLGDKKPYSLNTVYNDNGVVVYVNGFFDIVKSFFSCMRINNIDVLYLNGFFSFYYSILPLVVFRFLRFKNVRVVLAVRGESASTALSRSRLKKKFIFNLLKYFGFYKKVKFHVSSRYEFDDLVFNLRVDKASICIVQDPISAPHINSISSTLCNAKIDAIKIAFVGRISEVKNLDYALRVLSYLDFNVIFNIYGVIEDLKYWSKCQEIISHLPPNIVINYKGAFPHNTLEAELSTNDLLFLPTKGENFGHVIYEFLSLGLPVLISDRTPWFDLMSKGVGWSLPLDEIEFFVSTITSFERLSTYERQCLRERCLIYAWDFYNKFYASNVDFLK